MTVSRLQRICYTCQDPKCRVVGGRPVNTLYIANGRWVCIWCFHRLEREEKERKKSDLRRGLSSKE